MLKRVCSPDFWGNDLELKMKTIVKLFVFAGLVLLIAGVIAWKIPASWVLGQVNWSSKDIRYARVTGSLWEGKMEQLDWHDVMLGDVNWDFQTLNDFSPIETTWKIDGKGLDYEMNFFLDFEGSRAVTMRYVTGSVPAGWLGLTRAVPGVFLTGRFDIDLDTAATTGYPGRLASGTVRWPDAGISGLVEESLGTVILELRSERGFTIADIQTDQTEDAPKTEIIIAGEVKYNSAQYMTDLLITATPGKQYVIEQLSHLGTVLPDGSLQLELSGTMPR